MVQVRRAEDCEDRASAVVVANFGRVCDVRIKGQPFLKCSYCLLTIHQYVRHESSLYLAPCELICGNCDAEREPQREAILNMMQSTQVTKTGMMKEHAIVVDMPTESPKTHDARDTPLQQQCTWYPHCCGRPVFRGNREALGWCMDVIGRTLSILSIGAFLMPALLTLAKEAASCPDEGENAPTESTAYAPRRC